MSQEKIKVKINIAGRYFPMMIAPDEEEIVRKAGAEIQDKIKAFEQQYDVQDKQDVLSMIALSLAIETKKNQSNIDKSQQVEEKSIQDLLHLINQNL